MPKLLLSECLGLASLVVLAWRLRSVERLDVKSVLRQPVVLAVVPILVVASLGLVTSEHSLHVREGLGSLWIGLVCLLGWSLGLTAREHRSLLQGLIIPAVVLAVLALLQFFELYNPFEFERRVGERIGLTSLAGGAFDLAAYLILPCLIAQLAVFREARRRWLWAVAGGVVLVTVIISQTLTALAALGAATVLLWFLLLPRRRFAAAVGVVVLVGGLGAVGFEPLRERLERKISSLERGDVNRLLTGRLDGWRAAVWMLEQKPLTGVGQGAYRAEFGNAKLALREQGVEFYRSQHQVYFTTAHSDIFDALAEWGLVGAVALLWALWQLALALRKVGRAGETEDRAVMAAGLLALLVLAASNFPFHVALVAYPALLFVGWIFAAAREATLPEATLEEAAT